MSRRFNIENGFVIRFYGTVLLCSVLFLASPLAQTPDSEPQFAVQFVRELSSAEQLEKRSHFRLFDFIFGKENERLMRPLSLTVKDEGDLYVLDQGALSLTKLNFERGTFKSLLGDDKELFPSLVGICQGPEGDIFFTDSRAEAIVRLHRDKIVSRNFSEPLKLRQPTGIAYDPKRQEFWLAETALHRLTVLNSAGKFLRTVGHRGTKAGEFNFPTAIWVDSDGLVYVIDSGNFRIQILQSEGPVVSVFGEAGDSSGYFARPKAIATDTFGHIYVVDGLFNTVQIFDREGRFLYQFGEQGKAPGEFLLPAGIFIDKKNFIYIADSLNSRIQVFKLVQK